MGSTINYKGNQISSFNTGTKTLKTSGKYMEDDVTVSVSDPNLAAGNIKHDVSILGVTGNYEGSGSAMKEFASVAAMNAAIATIAEGEVVKVTTGPTYYIKDTGVMVQLVKETETLTPTEYNTAVNDTEDILGE